MSDSTIDYTEFSSLMDKLSYTGEVNRESVCDETEGEKTLYSVKIDTSDPESKNAIGEIRSIFDSCVELTVRTTAFEKNGSVYLYPEENTSGDSSSSFSPSKHRVQ